MAPQGLTSQAARTRMPRMRIDRTSVGPPIRPQPRGWHVLPRKNGIPFKLTLAYIAFAVNRTPPTLVALPSTAPQSLAALQLADPAAAATRYPDLSPADLAALTGNRDSLRRCVLGRRNPAHHSAAYGP